MTASSTQPATGAEDDVTLSEALIKTIQHFVPEFFDALADVKDFRDPDLITYPIEELLLVGILAFLVKVEARRNIKYKLAEPKFIENLKCIGEVFYPDSAFPDTSPHGDTLNYLLSDVDLGEIEALRLLVIHSLIRGRHLEKYRIQGYYPISVDGTGCWVFGTTRHCEHCLKKTHNGETFFYHPVLEAKLTLWNGFAFSVGTEFIENEREDVTKQDCELKAFYRLTDKLKRDFPQLRICLLLDGLFAGEPVFARCEKMEWEYLIVFKEGKMPATFKEYEALLKHSPKQTIWAQPQKNLRQTFKWINDIDYNGRKLHAFECFEEKPNKETRFVWLSSFRIDADNVRTLGNQGGRCRWIIENQGFNVQKNGGYELEHAFSRNNTAMKSFYVLMQIAHIFNQLMEKGSLIWDRLRDSMGSLKVFSLKMWAALTQNRIDPARLRDILAQRIQIRFESG